jgi:ribosomal-protein-alanine N-acetyltransferase
VPDLQLLRADHAPALLTFELENRSYFAAAVPDRGDDYFATFTDRHGESLALQAEGTDRYYVLVEEDGEIVGRINLYTMVDGSAEIGYRIAQRVAGHGLASNAVRQMCDLAVAEYGLLILRAKATVDNVASRTVLTRAGFIPIGDMTLNDRPGIRYQLELNPPA